MLEDLLSHLKIPNLLGVPASVITIIFGFVKWFQDGNVFSGSLSVVMSLMGAYYLWTKIQGQRLDNEKKNLSLTT